MKRRLIAALLALILISALLPVTTFASSPTLQEIDREYAIFINPLDADEEWLHTVTPPLMSFRYEDPEYLTSTADVIKEIRRQFKARTESFTVYYKTNTAINLGTLGGYIEDALAHTGVPDEGDYLYWSRSSCEYGLGGIRNGITYYYEFTINTTYHATAAQEAMVTEAVQQLRAELHLDQLNDYETVKAVYDWLCDNVTYDYGEDAGTYPLRHSAYGALISKNCVCQGYALALYRLLLEEGIDCRIISGDSNGDGITDHGWNIIKLGNKYYNADSTWDALFDPYEYFLVCEDNFPEHDRDPAYDTPVFHAAYPMGTEDYMLGNLAEGICGSDLSWTLDRNGLLTVSGSGAMTACPWRDYADSIERVVLSDGITSLCAYAFSGCSSIAGISLPENIADIGSYAFEGCSSLTGIAIPAGVTAIGDSAFANCASLESVRFEGDAPSFGNDVFKQVTATVRYPGNYSGWTANVQNNYGGNLTWEIASCQLLGKEHTAAKSVCENVVEATCETEGSYDEVIYCSICTAELSREKKGIQTLPHTEAVDKAVASTCKTTGLTEGMHCSVCDQVLVKQEIVKKSSHDWSDWNITVEATETASGEQIRTCDRCGDTETKAIPATGDPIVPPAEDNKPIHNPFTDVYDSDYYFDPVLWAVGEKITTGMTATNFAPGTNCTRGQIVTFLWRAQGCPDPISKTNPFTDVTETDYFYTAVLWAVEAGITNGLSANSFGPGESCTRGQVATFLWRAQGKPAYSGQNIFCDLEDGGYYYHAVLWAVENGVTNGMGDGIFAPNDVCTRGQIVTFLHRAMA